MTTVQAGYASIVDTNDIVRANVRTKVLEVIHQTVRTYESAKTVRKFRKGIEVSYEQNSA